MHIGLIIVFIGLGIIGTLFGIITHGLSVLTLVPVASVRTGLFHPVAVHDVVRL